MTKFTALSKIKEKENPQPIGNFMPLEELSRQVEFEIKKFMENNKQLCEIAKNEGWLGEPWAKGSRGLLGYMRTSFAMQIRILDNLDNHIPIYQNEFCYFFRSDFFRDAVKKNNAVTPIYKKEHFEIIKKYNL